MVDRCLQHITLYIHTKMEGTIMLEINKNPFRNNVWQWSPVLPGDKFTITGASTLKTLKSTLGHNFSDTSDNSTNTIINDGRLLQNYYDYDFTYSSSVATTEVLIMLIEKKLAEDYNFYMIRIYNLVTHADSIVYRDYLIPNVSSCMNINIEQDNTSTDVITISLLCDSTILKYVFTVKENLMINTQHEYWDSKIEDEGNTGMKPRLIVVASQDEAYHGYVSQAQLSLRVLKVSQDETALSSKMLATGLGTLALVGIASLIIAKVFLKE